MTYVKWLSLYSNTLNHLTMCKQMIYSQLLYRGKEEIHSEIELIIY